MARNISKGRVLWAAVLAGAVAAVVLALVVLPSEPSQPPAPEQASPQGDARSQSKPLRKTGKASWYDFSGEETASGEIMDEDDMTAAHRSLPFGTKLRVKNLENGKDVTVRVNDRGPYAKDRIIDVSEEAAERLDMIEDGVAKVRIKKAAPPQEGAASSPAGQPD